MNPIRIETARLVIRDFVPTDLEAHHRLMSNPQIMYFLQDIMTHSVEQSKENIEAAIKDISNPRRTFYFLYIEDKSLGKQIGELGYTVEAFTPLGKIVHMGYFSHQKYWGKGYMTEAVQALVDFAFLENDVYRITTGCLTENQASERVMIKCDFIKEAEHQDWEWLDGKMRTRVEYRLLRKEWQKNRITSAYRVPLLSSQAAGQEIKAKVPGSKSITNRALLLATLADGKSILRGALFSEDSRYFLECISELGFETTADEAAGTMEVTGLCGSIPKKEASIYVGSAGTAARFLGAYLGISKGTYHLDASAQMRRRPMAPLLAALRELGCTVHCEEVKDCFPFTLQGNGFGQHKIAIDINHSSQFLSALLIAAGLSPEEMQIQVTGTHGMSYIEMTRKMMQQFGVVAAAKKDGLFTVKARQQYQATDYQIEPDVSAACYFYALAPLLGITVMVKQIHFDSLQGDIEFLRILKRMGCELEDTPEGIRISGKEGRYQGVEVNMSTCSDQAITLAALAPFAETPTTITGIGHIRCQECDRIYGIVTELRKLGIKCQEQNDRVTIYPGNPTPGLVLTYEDHRMAMGFSLIGLRAPGIVIDNPKCCRKTFEQYFEVLDDITALCKKQLHNRS